MEQTTSTSFQGLTALNRNEIKESHGSIGLDLADRINDVVAEHSRSTGKHAMVLYDAQRSQLKITDPSNSINPESLPSQNTTGTFGMPQYGWYMDFSRQGSVIVGNFRPTSKGNSNIDFPARLNDQRESLPSLSIPPTPHCLDTELE